jgi:hypothetical protein
LEAVRHFAMDATSCFVTAAGFEDRSLAFSNQVRLSRDTSIIVLSYLPADSANRMKELLDALRDVGGTSADATTLAYDRFAPDAFYEQFVDRIRDRPSVILNMSAMSKLSIMICLEACRAANKDVSLLYSEARHYGPSQQMYETARRKRQISRPSLQVETDVHGVVRVSCLSSVAMQGQPTAAIAFMSFNELLTQALVNSTCPGRLFLINGRPPVLTWRERATAWIHSELRREWPSDDNPLDAQGLPLRATSTLDYRETIDTLFDLYWKLSPSYRVILAPTGSKMQAVAGYLLHAVHPDVHVEYPTARGFLDLYSKGVGRAWRVNLGKLGNLVENVRMRERETMLQVAIPGTTS